jgi:hypothetical protein
MMEFLLATALGAVIAITMYVARTPRRELSRTGGAQRYYSEQ